MRMVIDPICGRKTKHDYAEILTYLVAGFLSGKNSIRRCLKWCESHIDFLREYLELKNGIVLPAAVSRILSSIDEEVMCLAFIEWMTGILLKLLNIQGSLITMDAIGTTQSIMNCIVEKEADYLLTVKKGNPLTYQETKEMFEKLKKEKEQISKKQGQAVVYEKQLASYDIY